jgi:uncharacterized protein (TIGR01244 family)
MQRLLFALLAGGLFGAGLTVSGMIDTTKVQGWLDVFGNWDPTLAFVMGGAILPMAVAWQLAARRSTSYLGFDLPKPAREEIGPDLVLGSVMFGMGWALVGLCPGPALASLSFGGWGGLGFFLAMLVGMALTPALRSRFFATTEPSAPRSKMDIRPLTPTYAVSPQIEPADLAAIKAAGYTTVIDNRPDGEIPSHLHTPVMKAAAEELGLTFVANPVIGGALTMENVRAQAQAIEAASGPVFAYCASGNRCSVVWALMSAGSRSTDDLIKVPAKYGYNLEPLRGQINALAVEAAASKD